MNGSRRSWLIAFAALIVLLLAGNARLLLGRMAPQFDAADFFGPQFGLVGDEARAGRLVKWDPWVGGGNPDWTEPELGATSPVLLFWSLLSVSPQEGYTAYWMAVWIFGGIGMLLLARHLGAPPLGAAITTFGFITSGFYTGHAEHISSLYSVSFLPWIVWRLDAGLHRRDWWLAVQAGALFGLSGLGGYPAFTIMNGGFLIAWVLGRVLWRDRDPKPRPGYAALLLALTFVLGGIIFSQPYAGILFGTRGFSDRIGPRPRDEAISSNLLQAGALTTFSSPYLTNLNFPPNPLWPLTDLSMTSMYAGAASVGLALFGWRRRAGWRWWLVLLGAFFVAFILGSQLPLRGWLYDFVPPTRYFRNPALFRIYVIFIIAILAALATRDLSREDIPEVDRLRLWLLAIFAACASGACFLGAVRIAHKTAPELNAAILQMVIAWLGFAALCYLLKERWLSTRNFLRAVALVAFLDGFASLFISWPELYSPATLSWWHEVNARHNTGLDLSKSGLPRDLRNPEILGSHPNNRNVLTRNQVFSSYIVLWNRFQASMTGDPLLSRMATGPDRMWFSSSPAWRTPDDASFGRFRDRVHELAGTPILVLHSPAQMLALAPPGQPSQPQSVEPLDAPGCELAALSNLSYQPDSLSFHYDARTAGYLLVTDRWARGWEATVNGVSKPVLGGNFIFRAVEVRAGPNTIEFQYKPSGYWPLLFVGWGCLLAIGIGQCVRLFRGQRLLAPALDRAVEQPIQ